MRRRLFAANWKMHLGPAAARRYVERFRKAVPESPNAGLAFFPPAVSLEAVIGAFGPDFPVDVGVQDVHWEPHGAYTGAISVPMVAEAGARMALVGHSERRHLFGETDAETAKKVRAVLAGGLQPLLCVGEKLEERERGLTESVVARQLAAALDGLEPAEMGRVIVAYEPVWAIGTGRNASPQEAALIHRVLREDLARRGVSKATILYGGSVNLTNAAGLLAEPEIDGVLAGGASLDPEGWAAIISLGN
jgi:triosephosphate isomerase